MTIGSILFGVALLVLVGAYVFRPMFAPAHLQHPLSQKEQWLAEKDALIAEIKTLDFDHETGKLPDDYYAAQRDKLKLAAADALRQATIAPAHTSDLEAQIEAAIAAIRATPSGQKCPHCQQPVAKDDKFCRECGGVL